MVLSLTYPRPRSFSVSSSLTTGKVDPSLEGFSFSTLSKFMANLYGFFRSWGLLIRMPRLVFSATFSVGNLVVAFLGTFILLIKRSSEFVRPFWHFGPQLFKERSPFSRPGLGAYVSQPETFPGNFQLLEAQICLLLKLRWQFIRKRRTYRKIVFASIIAYLHLCNFGNTKSGTPTNLRAA